MEDGARRRMLQSVVCLPAVHLQSLSELERYRLQEIALGNLRERGMSAALKPGWQSARKLEKRRQDRRDSPHGVFGVPLSYVIAQDRAERHRSNLSRNRRANAEVESTVLSFRAQSRRTSTTEALLEYSVSSTFRNSFPQTRRVRASPRVPSCARRHNFDVRIQLGRFPFTSCLTDTSGSERKSLHKQSSLQKVSTLEDFSICPVLVTTIKYWTYCPGDTTGSEGKSLHRQLSLHQMSPLKEFPIFPVLVTTVKYHPSCLRDTTGSKGKSYTKRLSVQQMSSLEDFPIPTQSPSNTI